MKNKKLTIDVTAMLREDAERLKPLLVAEEDLEHLPPTLNAMVLAVMPSAVGVAPRYHRTTFVKWLEKNDLQRSFKYCQRLVDGNQELAETLAYEHWKKIKAGFNDHQKIMQALLANVWCDYRDTLDHQFLRIAALAYARRNYVFLSGDPEALKLAPDERRYMVEIN